MSTPVAMELASIDLGLVVLQHGPQVDAEPDRLAVDEVMAGHVLEAVQEGVVDAVHVAGIPARVVEGGAAPAMGRHQRPGSRRR